MTFETPGDTQVKLNYKRPNSTKGRRNTIFGTLLAPSYLPEDFDSQVKQLELKVEKGGFSKFVITTLLELYNQGADHYDKMDQAQYADDYRTRIQELLIKPEIIQVCAAGE